MVFIYKPLILKAGVTLATTGSPDPRHYADMARLVRSGHFNDAMIRLLPGSKLESVWVDGLRSFLGFSFFLIASAVPLTEAVSGDFWGWRHGLSTFGILALLLIAHEVFASWTGGSNEEESSISARRIGETVFYLLLGAAAWGIHRLADKMWGPG